MLHARALAALALLLFSLGALAQDLCAVCRQPVFQGYRVDNKTYCSQHWQSALPHCANCGSPITSEYKAVGAERIPFCSSCVSRHPACFLCASPADPKNAAMQLPDGRQLCGRDRQTAVFSPQRARELFVIATSEVVSALGPRMALKVPVRDVKLVDVPGLVTASRGQYQSASVAGGRILGLTQLVLKSRGSERWTEPATVYLLNGVPEERFVTVSAHEYTHAWHGENHPRYSETSPEMREGFAEWVAYKVAQHARRTQQTALLNLPIPSIYYTGLKKYLDLERRVGVEGVLRHATSATSI